MLDRKFAYDQREEKDYQPPWASVKDRENGKWEKSKDMLTERLQQLSHEFTNDQLASRLLSM